jgi:hypothetical protein
MLFTVMAQSYPFSSSRGVIEITPLAEDQVSWLPADFRNGGQCYGCNARSNPVMERVRNPSPLAHGF